MGNPGGRAVRGLCGAAALVVALGGRAADVDERGRITLTPEEIRACARGCVLMTADVLQAITRRLESCARVSESKGGDPILQGQAARPQGGALRRPVSIEPVGEH